jgi:hypothetical protein
MQRETHKSLFPRIQSAMHAIDAGRIDFADEGHVEKDIDELGLSTVDDYLDLIYECLQIAAEDPVEYYKHPQEPTSTKHPKSSGLRMWPFAVPHPDFAQPIYFKFCLRAASGGANYIHIDCHGSRPKNRI